MRAEILAEVLHDEGEVATARGRRKSQIQTGCVLLVHLESLEFFELLDARLHLHGLGGFVAETLDELFCFLNHLLLVEVGAHLLLVPFASEFEEMAVVDVVVVDAPEGDFDGSRGDIVDERAVVADEDEGTVVGAEEVLQPLDRLDVEVVGRLVK